MSLEKKNTNCQVVVIRQQNYSTERLQGLRCTGLTEDDCGVTFDSGTLATRAYLKIKLMHLSGNFPLYLRSLTPKFWGRIPKSTDISDQALPHGSSRLCRPRYCRALLERLPRAPAAALLGFSGSQSVFVASSNCPSHHARLDVLICDLLVMIVRPAAWWMHRRRRHRVEGEDEFLPVAHAWGLGMIPWNTYTDKRKGRPGINILK